MSLKSYKELVVWQKSMDLVVEIYKMTKQLPKFETYGLSSQMQRASIAIPSNIAEGSQRGKKEYVRFLSIAKGSAAEIETQIELVKRIYPNIGTQKTEELADEVLKMLSAMIKKLQTPNP